MTRHHNEKLIFGVLVLAFLCLTFCPAVVAETVTTELYSDNTQEYGDPGLILSTSFDETIIPTDYNRATAQIELGNSLYSTVPDKHMEIVQAYHDRYPELNQSVGNTTYVYSYGNRLTVTYFADGSLGIAKYMTELPSVTARNTYNTGIKSAVYEDLGWWWQPHTTVTLRGSFDCDGHNYPVANFVDLVAVSHDNSRTYTATHNDYILPNDNPQLRRVLQGDVTTTKVSGVEVFQYRLTLTSDKAGDVIPASERLN